MSRSRSMILVLCVSFVLLVINANSQQATSIAQAGNRRRILRRKLR